MSDAFQKVITVDTIIHRNQAKKPFIITFITLNSLIFACTLKSDVTITIDGKNIPKVATIAQIIQYTLYQMNPAEMKNDQGVTCHNAIQSLNSVRVIQCIISTILCWITGITVNHHPKPNAQIIKNR